MEDVYWRSSSFTPNCEQRERLLPTFRGRSVQSDQSARLKGCWCSGAARLRVHHRALLAHASPLGVCLLSVAQLRRGRGRGGARRGRFRGRGGPGRGSCSSSSSTESERLKRVHLGQRNACESKNEKNRARRARACSRANRTAYANHTAVGALLIRNRTANVGLRCPCSFSPQQPALLTPWWSRRLLVSTPPAVPGV